MAIASLMGLLIGRPELLCEALPACEMGGLCLKLLMRLNMLLVIFPI